jgi:hypothetical protein
LRWILLAAVLVWVVQQIATHLVGLRTLSLTLAPRPLLLAAGFAVSWIVVQSSLWRVVLGGVGAAAGWRAAIAQVWLPNLGKYVPGKVWAVVGRVWLTAQCGVPAAHASVGLLVENVCFILGGALCATGALVIAATSGRTTTLAAAWAVPVVLVVAGGLIAVHPRVWGGVSAVVLRRLGREPVRPAIGYGRSLLLVAGYVASWSVLGCGLAVWSTMIVPLAPAMQLRVVGLFLIAWAVGYLSMLAPAGLGVREGILIAGLQQGGLAPAEAVAIALGLRVYFTLVDLVGAVVAVVVAPELARRLVGGRGAAVTRPQPLDTSGSHR